jgi:hypothetical protein
VTDNDAEAGFDDGTAPGDWLKGLSRGSVAAGPPVVALRGFRVDRAFSLSYFE